MDISKARSIGQLAYLCGCLALLASSELPRCVLSGSRSQLLDPSLGTTQEAIDLKAVGVGADLRRDPAREAYQ